MSFVTLDLMAEGVHVGGLGGLQTVTPRLPRLAKLELERSRACESQIL